MAARSSTSKKRSVAKAATRLPEEPIFFLDRNLGKKISALIAAAGCRVEVHDDHFAHDAADEEILREIGKSKWIFLTKDRRIAYNLIEVIGLLESGSPAFVFTAGSVTSEELGKAFATALPDIKRFLSKFSWPFIATITLTGRVQNLITHSGLIKKIP
jgi:predicted nuclease of predicted toxin-antitoxin system